MLSPRSCKQCLRQREFVKTIGNDVQSKFLVMVRYPFRLYSATSQTG